MRSVIAEWCRRVWYLLNRDRFEASLKQEMEAHRAMMGEPVRFGNTLRLREDARDAWGWSWLDHLVRDARFATRALRRAPGFTLVAVLSLGIGLALAASTVAIVNAYLVRSLPYAEADRVYHLRYAPPGPWEPRGMTALDWTSVEDVVEFPIASSGDTFYLRDGGHAIAIRGLRGTRGFFEGLGVPVSHGRRLSHADFQAASEPVVLIGHSLWRDGYGSDPGAVGRSITVEAETRPGRPETFRIVGVLPSEFYIGRDRRDNADLLIPHTVPVRAYMVRLRQGVPPALAERRLTDAARRAATSPIPDDWTGVQLESVRERYVGELRPILIGVTIAASLVLVIVCANVAVLVLLRAMRRQKEVAVRLALGSGMVHIARMFFAETSLICGAALAAGLTLTAVSLRGLAPLVEAQLGRPAPRGTESIAIDSHVLLLVGGVSVIVALSLSLAPLLTTWGRQLADSLRRDGRVGTDGPSMRRLRSTLIALEVAGSLVLLAGCGLMIRSVVGMLQTDFGFETDRLARTRIVLRARNYPAAAAYQRFFRRFADDVSTLAGSPVVFTNWPPFSETPAQTIEPDGGGGGVRAGAVQVSAGYFEMLGIDIRQGRAFTATDESGSEPVAVISETLARRFWPDGSGVGRRVRAIEPTPDGPTPGPWRTVVGISSDVRQIYGDENRNDFYTPMFPAGRYASFYVRSDRPLPQLLEGYRAAASAIDPDAVVNEPQPMAAHNRQLAGMRFLTSLLTGFAAIAAFLAALGIYGVTAYAVQQREKEIAIRIALGASGRAVVRLFLRDGGVMLGAGLGAGLFGAVAAVRILKNQVYGVQPFDIWTLAAASVLMSTAGVLATWWPAHRAAAANPVSALNAN